MEIYIGIVIGQAFICGFLTQMLATIKGYDGLKYFWIGFLASFLGLLFVVGLPTRKE